MNPYNVTGPSNSQVAQVESIVSVSYTHLTLRWQIQTGYALHTKTLILFY